MRILVLIVCVLSISLGYGQTRGGGQGVQRGASQGRNSNNQQQRSEIRAFNAFEIAGIFSYDIDEAIKKIKLNKNKLLIPEVRKAIINYNNKVNDIGSSNKGDFDTLNISVNAAREVAMYNRNQNGSNRQMSSSGASNQLAEGNDVMRNIRKLVREKIEPIKRAVKDEENTLNMTLESLLDDKQYENWLKYQKKVKESLNPKPQSNKQNNDEMGRGGGQGRPGGGGGMR